MTMLIARVNARLGDFEMGQPGERVPEQSGQTPCCIAPPPPDANSVCRCAPGRR